MGKYQSELQAASEKAASAHHVLSSELEHAQAEVAVCKSLIKELKEQNAAFQSEALKEKAQAQSLVSAERSACEARIAEHIQRSSDELQQHQSSSRAEVSRLASLINEKDALIDRLNADIERATSRVRGMEEESRASMQRSDAAIDGERTKARTLLERGPVDTARSYQEW